MRSQSQPRCSSSRNPRFFSLASGRWNLRRLLKYVSFGKNALAVLPDRSTSSFWLIMRPVLFGSNHLARRFVEKKSQLPDPRKMRHYFIGEKSVGRMYIRSTFSTRLSASSDLIAS
jgi:hypothetical protein